MGIFSKFENKMEDVVDDFGDKFFDSPISPVQIAKTAEKQMRRNKMVGAGKQYAPTLYTVLVNSSDDARLKGYYPTLAGETETYLKAKALENGLSMDGDPLVRFMDDPDLKPGKFDVIAEAVAADIIVQLRAEEMESYGINNNQARPVAQPQAQAHSASPAMQSVPDTSSSAFADYNISQNPVQPAVAQTPTPQATPAPAQVPVQQPKVAPAQVPNQVPITPANQVNSSAQNGSISNSPTAVFAGGFDIPGGQKPVVNQAIPPANLKDISSGRVYTLNQATIVIGRESSCNISLPDVNASRQHAQINYNNGLWMLSDLGSTNGTFINNQEITSREIHAGDVITIGVTNLVFSVG